MRILVTGAQGILGRAIREWLASGNTLYLWGRDEVDVRDKERVFTAAKGIEFDAVIHAAAMTAVDRCETEYDLALATNREGTRHVASLAAERGKTMVYLSTDYVFDGTKSGPYLEDDPPKPINAYGRSKLAGEQVTREIAPKHLIVRTSWVFGEGGANFVDAIANKLNKGEAPEVVTDQRGCPTYARDLARGIEKLLRLGTTGTVHVTNTGETTWHGFAVEIARYLGSPLPVRETTSDRFQRPAPRPPNSVLSGDRFRTLTGESLPAWQDAVHDYLGRSARKGAAA
ncbi:MAG TPA: dTDP-4-dehydrorhamnose reductase [Candidatus Polarisedimenticolia bacterium]|nr:dTDP-4-dehydrorhamnose reductase [Candidatus Polarisedimenticolia bacterium]